MVGNVDASSVAPVVNPEIGDRRRQRLIRMTKEQVAGRSGPVRQIRYRNEVVSPLALEAGCRALLLRAQRAIAAIMMSEMYARDLRLVIDGAVLRRHEWEIAVSLREITELLLDMVASSGGGTVGPMTAAVLVSQNRAISLARDGVTARLGPIELLAAHVAAAEAARRDWETAHRLAAQNDKYLDLVARTAADQHAAAELAGLAERAADAERTLRETLERATLAAESLALPLPPPTSAPVAVIPDLERVHGTPRLFPADTRDVTGGARTTDTASPRRSTQPTRDDPGAGRCFTVMAGLPRPAGPPRSPPGGTVTGGP